MTVNVRFCIMMIIALLTGCTNEELPSIESKSSFFATVNIKEMSVTFIEMNEQKQIGVWNMDRPYSGGMILPKQKILLLYGKDNKTVDLYSLEKGKRIGTWRTGPGIVNGRILKEGEMIALADQNQDAIRFFNPEGKELFSISTETNPLGMVAGGPTEQFLYVTSFNSDLLTIIDIEKQEKLDGFLIHSSAAGLLVKQKTNELWIGGHGEGAEVEESVHVYNLNTKELNKELNLPSMPIDFLQKDNSVFVLSHGTSTLYKLNSQEEIIDSIQIGANPFDMTFIDEYLVVAGYDSNDVHIIDPKNLEKIKTLKVGKGPFQIISGERSSDGGY